MTVRVWLLSDLHLEDLDHASWHPSASPRFDVLACAGDVVEADPAACVDVVARLAAGRPCVLVLGNHDTWSLTIREALRIARERNPAVRILEGGESVTIAGLIFAGGTLWDDPDDWPPGIPRVKTTDATLSGEPILVDGANGARRATLSDLAGIHARTMEGIVAARPDVTLTHYQPSAADLARLEAPTVWMHGHLHSIRNEHVGRHHVVRVPCRRDINLLGAIVEFRGGGLPCKVEPVVGIGRMKRETRGDDPHWLDKSIS